MHHVTFITTSFMYKSITSHHKNTNNIHMYKLCESARYWGETYLDVIHKTNQNLDLPELCHS